MDDAASRSSASLVLAVTSLLPLLRSDDSDESLAASELVERLQSHEPLFERRNYDHVTASCIPFDPDFRKVLLVFHRKARFWVQPGGHLEPDDLSLHAGSYREFREETGVSSFEALFGGPVDLEKQSLGSSFHPCRTHFDVAYAVTVPRGTRITVSDESLEVRWFPVRALPETLAPGLDHRIQRAAERVRRWRRIPGSARA